jgi:hypothetical protein
LKHINLTPEQILLLLRSKEELVVDCNEVYFDKDAEDYLPTGNSEAVIIRQI